MLLELLEIASSKTLEYDPHTRARLSKLQGKTVVLHIKQLDQRLAISAYPQGLEFSQQLPDQVDVTLSATLGALLKISRDGMDNAHLELGELDIQGDPILGQRFAQIIADLNVDWQALLAEQIGDAPAKLITSSALTMREAAQQSQTHIKSLIRSLLTDELGLLADAPSVEAFLDDVDELRARAERLQRRIQQLEKGSG